MRLKFSILLVISITFFSCKSSKFITINYDYPKLNLDFVSSRISIIDNRETVSQEEDIKLPFVSHPNQLYEFHPKIKEQYKDIIEQTINENLNKNSQINSTISVFVLEARKKFSATFFTEQELVLMKLKFVIDNNRETQELIESSKFCRRSMDATYKKFEKLFQMALKETTYNALKKMKK